MKSILAFYGKPMSAAPRRTISVCASILAVGLLTAPGAPFAQAPLISTEASARGRTEHIVKADEWGRYAVEAKSSEGVAVEVVDKLRGVIARCEADAGKDGRLDLFLEAGEYKVFTEGPRDAQGNVRLEVTKFAPFDSAGEGGSGGGKDKFRYLPPLGQASTRLVDKEARGWWIFVPRDTVVYIEAMGRRLGNLAIFRERLIAQTGDGERYDFVHNSAPGKPLFGLRIVRKLTRGKYLVMAYGVGSDKYTVSDSESPLYMQWMLRPIEPGKPIEGRIGASGMNRYVAAPSPYMAYVVVESPKMQKLDVSYGPFMENSVSQRYSETLYAKSQATCCQAKVIEIDPGQRTVISVSGAPRTEFKITPVNLRNRYVYSYSPTADGAFQLNARYTTVMSDNIGVSGVLVDMVESSIVAFKADTAAPSRSINRVFNITSEQPISMFVWVDEAGTYKFTPGSGIGYQWRVKRFYVTPPQNYKLPNWARGRGSVSLAKGLHEIEIMPTGEKGGTEFLFDGGGNRAPGQHNAGVSSMAALGPFNLKNGRNYRFYVNAIPLELASVIVEKYPPPAKENVADTYLTGAAADKADSLSALSSQTLELSVGVPRYVTLGKRSSADYRFKIKASGIYKVETTGRLHTKVTLRDRFDGFSKSQSGNGVGRNALAVEFFLPGDYLAVVETEGESAGRMGVVLSKGDLRKGGALQDGVDKRAAVSANGAVVYDFKANKKARYRIESIGAAGSQEIRLEDSDGWPLMPHGAEAPQEAVLEKGAYKLYSLPMPYENYRVTRVDAVKEPAKFTGAGPHNIFINEPIAATWTESGAPARFLFEAPAPIDAKISLTPDFKGTLKQQGNKDAAPININGEYGGALQKGKYEIAVTPLKPQNYSPYELSVTTDDLAAGIGYDVNMDKTLRVQVGEGGGYEIFSQGRSEAAARLYASDKKTEIARSGGDLLDWNFFISERLDSGSYHLQLTGFDTSDYPPAKVFMRRAADTALSQVTLENAATQKRNVALSWKQIVIPIVSRSGDVLNISVSAGSRFVCELEAAKQGARAAAGRRRGKRVNISAVVEKGAAYTLRIWSEDRIDDIATVEIRAAEAIPLTFEAAHGGVSGTASKEEGNTVFYRVDDMDAAPGHYELIATENEISRVSGMNAAEDEAVKKGQSWAEIIRTPGVNTTSGIFEEEEGMLVANAGRRLFIGATFKSPDKFRFVMMPVSISDIADIQERNSGKFETADKFRGSKNRTKSSEREELPVLIRRGGDKVFAVGAPARNLGVVTLTMPAGQPIVGLSSPPQAAEFVRNGLPVMGGQYISDGVGKTVVIPGDTGRIIGWNAQTDGSTATGINAVFAMKSYKMEKTDTLKTGRTAWAAKRAAAKEFRVAQASGNLTVVIKLSPGTGVLYAAPDRRREMYYGGDDGAQYTATPVGGRLFLFGKADGDDDDGGIELETYAAATASKKSDAQNVALTAGAESVKLQPTDTREALRVKNGAKQASRLYWSGSVESVDWVNKSGVMTQNVKDGGKLTGESGVLLVNYKAGTGKIRLCKDDNNLFAQNACRWGEPSGKKDSVPAIKEISRLTMAHGVNLYAIELSGPTHVSVSAAAPAAAMVSTNDKIGAYQEFWDALRWDIPLPAGKHIVGIKPLTTGSLFGIPLTIGLYPILQLAEEKPLQTQIMASQNRLAAFELQKKSAVGIGLSTQSQTVEAALLDAKGKEIAVGSQIFKELDKGAYYVLLSVPPGATQNGVSATVRLFGQNNPPADPPVERIKRIIKDDRGESSDSRASR